MTPALKTWFLRATGLGLVVMENEPRPFVQQTWGRLQVINIEGHGMDDMDEVEEVDTTVDPTVIRIRQRVQGQRSFVLRCAIESLDQSAGGFAANTLERLRGLWMTQPQRDLLDSVNVCVSSFPNASQMGDVEVDEHTISAWFVDVEFNAGFTWIDTVNPPLDYFDSVDAYMRVPSDSEPEQVLP